MEVTQSVIKWHLLITFVIVGNHKTSLLSFFFSGWIDYDISIQ